jgi:hypothetical protein
MAKKGWEYSFCLHTCRLGDKVKRITNPFTGEILEVPIDIGLSVTEIDAVKVLLSNHDAEYGSDDEFHHIRFVDGTLICLGLGDLNRKQPIVNVGVNLICPELSDEAVEYVHAVAKAAGTALITSANENAALTAPAEDPKVRRRWPDAAMVANTNDLAKWLKNIVVGRKVTITS